MLKSIAMELNSIGIPYEFMRWSTDVVYPYFVGEYSEMTTIDEDGREEYTFILNGFTRHSWEDLEQLKEKIRRHFPSVGGRRIFTDDGIVVVFFDNAFPVATGEADLKRIQINLNVQKWKGAI